MSNDVKQSRLLPEERSKWIRERHRSWSKIFKCLDLDYFGFLALEYNNEGFPVALVEYKHRNEEGLWSIARDALCRLADASDIPALLVRYDEEEIKFHIDLLNSVAKKIIDVAICDGWQDEANYLNLLNSLHARIKESSCRKK